VGFLLDGEVGVSPALAVVTTLARFPLCHNFVKVLSAPSDIRTNVSTVQMLKSKTGWNPATRLTSNWEHTTINHWIDTFLRL